MKTKGYGQAQTRWKGYKKAYSQRSSKLFRQAGELISESISKNFESEGRPQWAPRTRRYPWPILWKTGRMRARAERTALEWIHQRRTHINRIYAPFYGKFHQFGTKRLPVRKFVHFIQKERDELRKLHKLVFSRQA